MSTRTSSLTFLLFALVVVVGTDAAGQCTLNTETKHVFVMFDGCALAQPGLEFDVMIGDEPVTVRKSHNGDAFWRGTTRDTFTIKNRTLNVDFLALPKARAACDVRAVAHPAGACVALYRVKCEPLWLVNVKAKKKRNDTTITYDRQIARDGVAACEKEPVKGPEVTISPTDTLLVKVDKPAVEIPVTVRRFGRGTELTLDDVEVRPVVSNREAAVAGSVASPDLAKELLRKSVPEMLFTKKEIPGENR